MNIDFEGLELFKDRIKTLDNDYIGFEADILRNIIEQDDAVYAMEVVSTILQLYEYKLNLLELEKLLNKNNINFWE